MHNSDRYTAIGWGFATAGLLGTVLMISSCVKEEAKISQTVKIECIKAGGNWEKVSDSDRHGCKMK